MREKAGSGADTVRFFADSMLGSLARWMRTLGYDVEYSSSIDDKELVERALEEHRIILTRDTLLVKRRRARGRCLFITGDEVGAQLRQVAGIYGVSAGLALTRCLRCNTLLEDIGKEAVEDKVPPYVYSTQERFSACLRCGRVYWAGTHRDKMLDEIDRLLKG